MRLTVGSSFNPRRNSLNFLRLFLALCVVLEHTVYGTWNQRIFGHSSLGSAAVFGFFGISGYLIAGSAHHNSVGRYLWQRCLRIFPAFWICLLVIGLLLWRLVPLNGAGPVAYSLGRSHNPLGYITDNWFLWIRQPDIYGQAWDASLWTLAYEFVCYLVLALLSLTGIMKRREAMLAVAGTVWFTQFFFTLAGVGKFNVLHNWFWFNLLKFASVFLVGSVIYLYRDVVPDSGWLALACGALAYGEVWIPIHTYADYSMTVDTLLMPLIAYPMIWLGIHLPFHKVGSKNDYSYAVYIYAFPVQVILTYWGVMSWGSFPFFAMVVICTIPFALASWWLIEKRALNFKHADFRDVWDRRTAPKAKQTQP